jgi:hydrogenase maturation protease
MKRAPVLVFGYGNPSRGDDALGPEFVRQLALREADAIARGELEVLTDFQLQIEHVLDLEGRDEVFFVDADASLERDFAVRPLEAQQTRAFTTHAMTPRALLKSFEEVLKTKAPASFVIAIGGESFELGAAMSARAAAHLEAALVAFTTRHQTPRSHAR